MPLGYDSFDFRRYLPPPASMYNVPVAADGKPPSFTTIFGNPPLGEDPPPIPAPPGSGPFTTIMGGQRPAAPEVPVRRVTTAPAAPVVVPDPPPPPIPPMTPGSDASTPLAPGASDYYRTPTSRKVPEVVTPIVGPTGDPKTPDDRRIPTPASTAPPPNTWEQELAKFLDNKDFSGAMKALSTAFKKPPAPPVYKMSHSSGGGGGVKDMSGSGQAMMANILKGRKGEAGELGRKKRQGEPEQERFDWRRRQGRR